MTDLVDRLILLAHNAVRGHLDQQVESHICWQAADRITQLEAEVEDLELWQELND